MAGIREKGAGGPPVPGGSDNTSPHSYDLVPDPDLRESLNQFENKVVKTISSWPLPASLAIDYAAEALTGLKTWEIYGCYDFIRNNNVIKLSSWNFGKNNRYGFDKDQLRAFFALLDIFSENLSRKDKYVKSLESIKEALGSHPLADQFNAPSPSSQKVKQNSLLPKPSEHKQEQKKPFWLLQKTPRVVQPKSIEEHIKTPRLVAPIEEKQIEEEEGEEEAEEDQEEQSPLEKIPVITEDQLRHMISFDRKEIYELNNIVPSIPDNIDFTRFAPFYVAQSVMFILEASRHELSTFDTTLESYNLISFKKGLDCCLQSMAKYPQFKNLFQLFQGVKQLVEKDIGKYWST